MRTEIRNSSELKLEYKLLLVKLGIAVTGILIIIAIILLLFGNASRSTSSPNSKAPEGTNPTNVVTNTMRPLLA